MKDESPTGSSGEHVVWNEHSDMERWCGIRAIICSPVNYYESMSNRVEDMKTILYKCPDCGGYTMKHTCTSCETTTYPTHPPRFSPEDRWGKYRRMLKKDIEGKENG